MATVAVDSRAVTLPGTTWSWAVMAMVATTAIGDWALGLLMFESRRPAGRPILTVFGAPPGTTVMRRAGSEASSKISRYASAVMPPRFSPVWVTAWGIVLSTYLAWTYSAIRPIVSGATGSPLVIVTLTSPRVI